MTHMFVFIEGKKKIAMRMQPKITQKSDYLDHENQTNQSPFLTQHFSLK